jgi:polysaccharide pyruvyl transferase WcaK-like protein
VEILTLAALKWPWDKLARHFRRADVVVDISGDDLTTAYGLFSPLQVLYEMVIAKMHGCRTALLAHSVGPFETTTMRALAVSVCRTADLVTLRELRSHTCWRRACPRRILDASREDQPLADLMFLVGIPRAGVDSDKGPIVVNVSRYVVQATQSKGKINGISTNLSSHYREWVGLIQYISRITGRKILLLPHTFRRGINDDRYFLKRIMKLCPSDLPVDLVEDAVTTFDVQKLVAGSSFVLSSRLHLALSALNCGVPFLALAYSHKYDQLEYQTRDDLSPTVYVKNFPPDQFFDVIQDRFEKLWKNRMLSRPEIVAHAQKSRELAGINMQLLFNMTGVE